MRPRRPRILYLEVADPHDLRLTGFFCLKPCPQSAAVAAFRRNLTTKQPPSTQTGTRSDSPPRRIYVVELEKHRRLYPYTVTMCPVKKNDFTCKKNISQKPHCQSCDAGWINLTEPQLHQIRAQIISQFYMTPRQELRDALQCVTHPLRNRRKRAALSHNVWSHPPIMPSDGGAGRFTDAGRITTDGRVLSKSHPPQLMDIRIAFQPSSSEAQIVSTQLIRNGSDANIK